MDRSGPKPIRVFESGAILLYLAEKFGAFLPTDAAARAECLSWLFWQMGSAPYLGGGFGHFYAYAPAKIEYAIDRFAMEVKRQLDVLDRRLADNEYLAGDRVHDRRYRGLALVWRPGAGPVVRRRRIPRRADLHERAALDRRPSPNARRCGAGAWSTASGAIPPANCMNAMTPAISRPKPRTRSASRRRRVDPARSWPRGSRRAA